MDIMPDVVTAFSTTVVVAANAVTACRLFVYRRGLSRYRFGMSALAYALIICSGGQVIDTLVNAAQATPWEAGFSAVIAILVCRAKGNVAAIMRCGHV